MSGVQASFGMDAVNGAKLAIEEINLAGGVLGHPVNLIIKDTESQPEHTHVVVSGLINTDKVTALVGEIATDRSLIAAPVAQDERYPDDHPWRHQRKGHCGRRLHFSRVLYGHLPGCRHGQIRRARSMWRRRPSSSMHSNPMTAAA